LRASCLGIFLALSNAWSITFLLYFLVRSTFFSLVSLASKSFSSLHILLSLYAREYGMFFVQWGG
jgi:hypothetical protein